MKPRILTTTIASLLLASAVFAVTDTWDGGGANDNFTTALNWVDNSTPLSNLANTDLIFSGGVRLTPTLTTSFSARSITFDNVVAAGTAGFNIDSTVLGVTLNVGAGGIVNNDGHDAYFGLPVSFSGVANATINAASGTLFFDPIVTVAGSSVLIGTSGDGTATVTDSGSSLSAGELFLGASGNQGSLTFSSASTGMFSTINVDSSGIAGTGGTLSIQSGSTVTGTALVIAPNAVVNTGTVGVSGAGSVLTLSGAATATIGATSASSGSLNVSSSGTFNSGTGLTTVNSTGLINISGGTYHSNGDLTLIASQLTRSSTGVLDFAAGTTFTIQGAATATITGAFSNNTASTIHLTGGGSALTTTGTLTISGAGSALRLSGATTIGAASASSGTVNLQSGGTLTTGTGMTTVNETGVLNINTGGTLIVRGDMLVKSALTIGNGGIVILDATAPPAPPVGEFVEPAPGGELDWDTTNLQATSDSRVVPEPGIGALLASALGFLGMRRGRIRGARASGVLVSAFRRNELPETPDSDDVSAFESAWKVREGGTPSPARQRRALPGTSAPRAQLRSTL